MTLWVAQAVIGIPSDRRILAVAHKRLCHLFPELPYQPGFHKRRHRLSDTIEWLTGVFASQSPGFDDDVLLIDSPPVECGRSVETARRSELADYAGYGYCRSYSRHFWGMRLHLCCAPGGTPRAAGLWRAERPEREVALALLPRAIRGGEAVVCDKGYAGAEFALADEGMQARVLFPVKTSPQTASTCHRSASASESVFSTCKDLLTLERHGARTIGNLRVRVAMRLLALAARISPNHQLGRPSRSLVAYVA